MSTRRRGREAALQLLFASELEQELAEGQDRSRFWDLCTANPKGRAFAETLVSGVLEHRDAIDEVLQTTVENYELNRLSSVDRNLLRIAVFEMRFHREAPPAVIINEAVEIAKSFGTPESSRFVNGVLDRIHKELQAN